MINGCDAGYPPEVEEGQPEEPDVELPNVWYGPQQYAEDFYSGGTVPTGARDASRIGETDEYEETQRNHGQRRMRKRMMVSHS